MRRRLLSSYLALTLVILLVLIVPLGTTYSRREREHLEAGLTRDAFVLSSYVEDALESGATSGLEEVAADYRRRTGARVVIVADDGTVVADSDPLSDGDRTFATRPEIASALDSRVAIGTRRSESLGTSLLYVAVPVASGGEVHGAVRLTYSTAQVDGRVHRYWWFLAAIAAVSLCVAVVVGLVLSRWVARPVQRLRDAAKRFGAGDFEVRADDGAGPPEVRELASAFNVTASRLQSLLSSQEQFVADASHQLRTPLTALGLRLELLEDDLAGGPPDPERAAADVAAARREVMRLNGLVEGLLALARADAVDAGTTAVPMDVGELLLERAAAWEAVAAEHGVELEVVPRRLRARATPDRVAQVVDNLIANAVDASPTGGVVRLEAVPGPRRSDRGDAVEIHVVDQGHGMDEEQRAHAFDRFWSGGPQRSGLGGSGLGLAITAKLVAADGGSVALEPASGGGVEAVVRLPATTERVVTGRAVTGQAVTGRVTTEDDAGLRA